MDDSEFLSEKNAIGQPPRLVTLKEFRQQTEDAASGKLEAAMSARKKLDKEASSPENRARTA